MWFGKANEIVTGFQGRLILRAVTYILESDVKRGERRRQVTWRAAVAPAGKMVVASDAAEMILVDYPDFSVPNVLL